MNHHPYPIVKVDDNSLLVLHKRLQKATKSALCILAFTLTRENWIEKEKDFMFPTLTWVSYVSSHMLVYLTKP